MANYAVTTFTTEDADYDTVMSALETNLETQDSTANPIRLFTVVYKEDTDTFVGLLVYDT